jgi:hypothetical protein
MGTTEFLRFKLKHRGGKNQYIQPNKGVETQG